MSRAILWFRADLRSVDNEALQAACTAHDEVLPVFIKDPRQHGDSPFGYPRIGPFRSQFLEQGLRDLDTDLRAKGSALRVFTGQPAAVLREVAATWNAATVYAQTCFGWEEQMQTKAVAEQLDLRLSAPNTLLHPDDLPFSLSALPHVFTVFRVRVEERMHVRPEVPAIQHVVSPTAWCEEPSGWGSGNASMPALDPRRVMTFTGGRRAGLERLHHYCGPGQHVGHYKGTRNELLGADNSSKLSPWLASGALGPGEVYRAVKTYEAQYGANESTYWMIFELLWRDFFQFTAAKHGPRLFQRSGIGERPHRGAQDRPRSAAWCEGRTGNSFIDANMRELAATGWMSNRGRQNVASYLVNELALDWRMGAYWFEHALIDYDPCSNWGNWQYLAGVGNDPREGRRFDPERQAERYDPTGAYSRMWS
jgi:deoxyribodipyrimidine photo-lyase